MSLKELNLKSVYYSDDCAILTDFYIPVLSNAIKYDRVAGYFCSNSLSLAAKGIAELIKNNGHVRLIANVVISEEDQGAIKEALKNKEREVLLEIDNLEDQLVKDHIKMLSWMIKRNLLEIKIAVVKNGIEHQKMGILEDDMGNKLSFSGSENETVSGWLNNDEQFHVFCSWKDGDSNHLKPDVERFNILWNDRGNSVRVFPISEAFKLGLLKNAPKNDSEFQILSKEVLEKMLLAISVNQSNTKKEIELHEYQKGAIQKWIDNNYCGIFEMATGTGKTFTALGCLKDLLKKESRLITIISCPYTHITKQWIENIEKFQINVPYIIADSSNYGWKDKLADKLYDILNGITDKLIVLTTHTTFSSDSFIKIINRPKIKLFLIVDEVHGIGSQERKIGLRDIYDYRLGLSATPRRWFDDDGTEKIFDFFGKTVFEFSLNDAITTINPITGKTYLTPYYYKPYFIDLTDEEFMEYQNESLKIAKMYHISKNKEEKEQFLTLLLEKRQKIIKNASNKLIILKEILDDIKVINDCLIYCSPQQIDAVQDILNNYKRQNIVQSRFTMETGTTPQKKFNGLSEREYLLDKFAEGTYQVLVAMNILDEGVDVPSAKTAIILSSTGNPKQYIQRRGRVLRRYLNKESATIYDIVVIPNLSKSTPSELMEVEKNILRKELGRYKEFANVAKNALECINKIHVIEEKYHIFV